MLLRNLFEAAISDSDAAFAFGRFNPAHQGHIEVYKAVQAAGDKWFVGTNPSTQGSNDPLTFEQKAAWMNAIYPPIKGHILAEQSVVTLASKLYEMLGDDKTIAYVTDEKDWAWAGKLLNDYNGKQGPHGYYKFRAIRHVESPRVSSATALRTAARTGDEAAFYAASGTDPKLTVNGQTYYDTVVAAVGANPEKVKRFVKKKEPAVAEVTGDKSFDSMMRTIKKGTAKQKTADRRAEKAASQQRARDAFGPNPAAGLGIRKPGVAEARKNPEQNTKNQSGWAELTAWASKNNVWLKPHEWAISMTYLPKLGINPGPGISEDTPRGIYFYPFQWAYSVKMDKEALPWADNAPYIQLFQYSTGTGLFEPNQIPLPSVVAQLKNYGITDEDIAAEKENDPGISTYALLVWCLGRKYPDNKRVSILNKILRNLGYNYMIDNGKGWIAINEPTQGVVLNPKIINKVITFNNYTRKKVKGHGVAEGLTTEKQILTRIRQIMYDRKLSGTDSNAGELLRLKQQLKDLRSQQGVAEGSSKAMAQAASRLTDPKDGATAKLRAAGDKRREDDLKSRNIAKKNEAVDLKTSLQELSNDMLGKYKKAAGADAKKADTAGDFKRGDKRFKGINQATVKQFDNDAKKPK